MSYNRVIHAINKIWIPHLIKWNIYHVSTQLFTLTISNYNILIDSSNLLHGTRLPMTHDSSTKQPTDKLRIAKANAANYPDLRRQRRPHSTKPWTKTARRGQDTPQYMAAPVGHRRTQNYSESYQPLRQPTTQL